MNTTVKWWRGFGLVCVVGSVAAFLFSPDLDLCKFLFGLGVFACAIAAILSELKSRNK
jgi:hypothetical protein